MLCRIQCKSESAFLEHITTIMGSSLYYIYRHRYPASIGLKSSLSLNVFTVGKLESPCHHGHAYLYIRAKRTQRHVCDFGRLSPIRFKVAEIPVQMSCLEIRITFGRQRGPPGCFVDTAAKSFSFLEFISTIHIWFPAFF